MKNIITNITVKLWLAIVIATIPIALLAADVPIAPGDYTGIRTTPPASGIFGTNKYASPPGFKISWSINNTNNMNPLLPWQYTYTITNESGGNLGKDLSHFILEVSIGTTPADYSFINPNGNIEGPQLFTPQQGNPGMPDNIFGIKFDDLEDKIFIIDFLSNRSPVWGDFYAKSGGGQNNPTIAYNTGFGFDPNPQGPFTDWIPRPDTHSMEIPEPVTVLLLSSGLASAAHAGYRKRKASKKP